LGSAAVPVWTTVLYAAASGICHQIPERSFHTGEVNWPVCARCTGLYMAAPFAAIFAFRRRRRRAAPRLEPWQVVMIAAIPTALTLAWEWGGMGTPSNLWRFATALPLGAVVTWVLIDVTRHSRPTEVIG
jgi:uncharacterized membrane protein